LNPFCHVVALQVKLELILTETLMYLVSKLFDLPTRIVCDNFSLFTILI